MFDRSFSNIGAGLAGGAAGLAAMDAVMRQTKRLVPDDPRRELPEGDDPSWSLIGEHHQPGESATEALARILYTRVVGEAPDDETKERLSNAIHRGYGLAMGALFGLVRGRRRALAVDLLGGAAFGVGLWLLGDELGTAALGLADKPTRFVPRMHLHTLAGHLAYGLATAAATRAADKLG